MCAALVSRVGRSSNEELDATNIVTSGLQDGFLHQQVKPVSHRDGGSRVEWISRSLSGVHIVALDFQVFT